MSRERLVAGDGTPFRDLDHDGVMAPFEDSRLRPEERADDLVRRLSLEEKAGLCFQDMLAVGAADDLDDRGPYGASPASLASGLLLNQREMATIELWGKILDVIGAETELS